MEKETYAKTEAQEKTYAKEKQLDSDCAVRGLE